MDDRRRLKTAAMGSGELGAAGCDVVVCWKHDWEECPVEVVELSTEVRRLRGAGRAPEDLV